MKNRVIAASLIVLLLGVLFVRWMSSPTSPERTERTERAGQDASDATNMPTELEAPVGTSATAGEARGLAPGRIPDAASIEAAKAARIAQLESKVAAEPVSATWAADNARRIESFLQADTLQAAQLPAVDHAGVDCRTTICRIELTTQDSLAAGELTQGILQTISGQMPSAQIFESEGPGGTTLLIFATAAATSEGPPFRPRR